jgi:hypothetical protein
MKTRHVKPRHVKTRRLKEKIILPTPLYPPDTDLSKPTWDFEYHTDCDVFTILSEKEKKQQWNKALTTFRKKIDEYISTRKKFCQL